MCTSDYMSNLECPFIINVMNLVPSMKVSQRGFYSGGNTSSPLSLLSFVVIAVVCRHRRHHVAVKDI